MSWLVRQRLATAAATLAVLGVAAVFVAAADSGDPAAPPGPPVAFPLKIGGPVGRPVAAGFLGFSIEFAKKDQADYLMALVRAAWVDTPWL